MSKKYRSGSGVVRLQRQTNLLRVLPLSSRKDKIARVETLIQDGIWRKLRNMMTAQFDLPKSIV